MNPTPRTRYPALARLFGAYLNQDYDVHGKDPLDAVRAFAKDAPAAQRAAAIDELRRLLAAAKDDADLDRRLGALRCGYLPSSAGRTARAFVHDVVATLTPRA